MFTGSIKANIENSIAALYNNKWWKSKSLEDLVNHEIMHAMINFNNSYERMDQLYEALRFDTRIKGFCRFSDMSCKEHPDGIPSDVLVEVVDCDKFKQRIVKEYDDFPLINSGR